jgi:type I restriction enzyme, R subunit
LAALAVVVQRPQELTREELRQLRLRLDAEGFSNANISRAWTDATNEEIAASIIGFIRQAAIGDPLVPYTDRVNAAVRRIAKSKQWTSVQRQWLDRIGEQMKQSIVVDRAAFDAEPFEAMGGWDRINGVFSGELRAVLNDLNSALWEQVG